MKVMGSQGHPSNWRRGGPLKAVPKPRVRSFEAAGVTHKQKRTLGKTELTSLLPSLSPFWGLRVPGWSLLGSVYILSLFRTGQENSCQGWE